MATPHLKSSARGQSILWRGLRPELVRSNPVPLSPDANVLVTHDAPDWCRQRDDVLEATRRLVNEVCSITRTTGYIRSGGKVEDRRFWNTSSILQPTHVYHAAWGLSREIFACPRGVRILLCSGSISHLMSTGRWTLFERQVIPRFAEELCQKELGSVDGASGYGFGLTADMHRRGIGVRHMGLLRDMFWRPLHGNVDLSFNSNRVRTRTDMRLQLQRGDQVSDARSVLRALCLKRVRVRTCDGLFDGLHVAR